MSPLIVDFSSPRKPASSVIRSRRSRRMPKARSWVRDKSLAAPILLSAAIVAKADRTSASTRSSEPVWLSMTGRVLD
jgi:hypothetical protein